MLLSFTAKAQNNFDIGFIEHLVNRGDYREALFIMPDESTRGSAAQNDSLNYLIGWAHYSLKELEPSSLSFLKVSKQSPFYLKSRFFAAYNYCYLSDFNNATNILNDTDSNAKLFQPLRNFELAGIYLLNNRYSEAENKFDNIDSTLSILYEPLMKMKLITANMKRHKAKSPLLAGLLSALMPGSGKIYAGKTGQGISSFIATVGFGLITWENYRKLGPTHFKTIAFGSAFAANYVAGIYGSALSAKIVENEYQTIAQNQVLFQLHIPLRNFFN